MDATMNVKGWYGFVGLGQMGGNMAKSVHVIEYPIMAANTAQSDLNGLDIPEESKYHILGGYGSSKERKKAKQLLADNNCENFVGLFSLWEVLVVVRVVRLCQL